MNIAECQAKIAENKLKIEKLKAKILEYQVFIKDLESLKGDVDASRDRLKSSSNFLSEGLVIDKQSADQGKLGGYAEELNTASRNIVDFIGEANAKINEFTREIERLEVEIRNLEATIKRLEAEERRRQREDKLSSRTSGNSTYKGTNIKSFRGH